MARIRAAGGATGLTNAASTPATAPILVVSANQLYAYVS